MILGRWYNMRTFNALRQRSVKAPFGRWQHFLLHPDIIGPIVYEAVRLRVRENRLFPAPGVTFG